MHHGVRIQDNALVAAAVLSQPLHHRPLPARQGDRPGRRGLRHDPHRDRLDAAGARRGHAPRHAARDRGGGAQEGEGQGVARSGWRSCARSSPTSRRRPTRCARSGRPRRSAIEERAQAARADRGGAPRDRARRARLRPEPGGRAAHGKLPELERAAARGRGASSANASAAATLLREEVTEEEIAEIVSRWTGIPVTRLVEGEREKLLRLDEILHQRVVGQDEAVQLVADAVIRARAGHQGPAPADRLVPLPRPHRRRQDRARQDARRRRSSTARRTWSASTCRSTWRSTPCRA